MRTRVLGATRNECTFQLGMLLCFEMSVMPCSESPSWPASDRNFANDSMKPPGPSARNTAHMGLLRLAGSISDTWSCRISHILKKERLTGTCDAMPGNSDDEVHTSSYSLVNFLKLSHLWLW